MKLLVLSLGTGSILFNDDERVELNKSEGEEKFVKQKEYVWKKLKNKELAYRTAKYKMQNGEIYSSPFVAEPLIETFQPDVVLLIGTVRSCWTSFYVNFKSRNDVEQGVVDRLLDYELKDAIDIKGDELNGIEKNIQEIMDQNISIGKKLNKDIKVYVSLIRYGLDDKQLGENYNKLTEKLEKLLEGNDGEDVETEIEVAFDITHSFRSMPIYNLVIINYFRQLSRKKIRISHVYYGNLDVSSEADGAKVVDLADIVDVLNLTSGVKEFINTGNATSLLKDINEEDDFTNQLIQFNGAMQINDRKGIQQSLKNMLSYEFKGDDNALVDAKKLIRDKLREEFPNDITSKGDVKQEQKEKADFQIRLAEWCLNTGRVGLASAIAKEAFRSFLVMIYEPKQERYEIEDARKRAEQMFGNRIKNDKESELFNKYKAVEFKARKIRNTYAHNLDGEGEVIDYEESKVTVGIYINTIKEIMCLNENELQITNASENASGDKIAILMIKEYETQQEEQLLNAVKEKMEKKGWKLFRLKNSSLNNGILFEIPSSGNTGEVRELSKIITLKIEEFLDSNQSESLHTLSIIWGNDIDEKLCKNCSVLIKSYMESKYENDVSINFNKFADSSEGTLANFETGFVWNVDAKKLLDDDEQYILSKKLDNYIVKKV